MSETCEHKKGTLFSSKTYPATLEMPSETIGIVKCDECGKSFELGYLPEGMELYDLYGRKLD